MFEPWPTQQKCLEYYEIVEEEGYIDIPSLDTTIIANLLSSFLRNLPDCLLCVDFYNDWVEASMIRDNKKRRNKFFALCQKLPKQNYVLLQYMLMIFRDMIENGISEGGTDNRNTPFFIAFLVGHLMLWPIHPCTKRPVGVFPEDGNELNERINEHVCRVVECLIKYSKSGIINIW